METEIMSIEEFMRRLVPSGQLPKHTRELLRTLEDLGVEVKVPSRACACLVAHTQRETFLLEAQEGPVDNDRFAQVMESLGPQGGASEKGLAGSEIARRLDDRFRWEQRDLPAQDVHLTATKIQEMTRAYYEHRQLTDEEPANLLGDLTAALLRMLRRREEFQKQYLGKFVPERHSLIDLPDRLGMAAGKSRLERGVDEQQRDEYACNEGLAFLTVEVAEDGGFVSDKSKLKA